MDLSIAYHSYRSVEEEENGSAAEVSAMISQNHICIESLLDQIRGLVWDPCST